MASHFEPFACLDLEALVGRDADADEPPAAASSAEPTCRGKLLLLVSARGWEIFRVPTRVH
jgi:hypothetical protein